MVEHDEAGGGMGDGVEQSGQQPVAAGMGARSGGDPDPRVDDPTGRRPMMEKNEPSR
ncbi:hypothetical protein [Actinoplanes sp. HUAS TT8]|uniref:hypothetical protein n=1 Tax=Actinoplanes sp. HUAS TT8 TaxID=3447453 RepID=UPI003F522275